MCRVGDCCSCAHDRQCIVCTCTKFLSDSQAAVCVPHTDALAICNHCCTLRPTKLNDKANVFNSNQNGGAMYWHHLKQVGTGLTFERVRRVQAFALEFAESMCGETLHPFSFSMWNVFILKYAGIKGSFGWHYDSEDEEDVRVLICVARPRHAEAWSTSTRINGSRGSTYNAVSVI